MRTVNPERLAAFMQAYTPTLARVAHENPEDYPWIADTDPAVVAGRMRAAFERGSYNYTGKAIRATCRSLGLKPTLTAIEAFLTAP